LGKSSGTQTKQLYFDFDSRLQKFADRLEEPIYIPRNQNIIEKSRETLTRSDRTGQILFYDDATLPKLETLKTYLNHMRIPRPVKEPAASSKERSENEDGL